MTDAIVGSTSGDPQQLREMAEVMQHRGVWKRDPITAPGVGAIARISREREAVNVGLPYRSDGLWRDGIGIHVVGYITRTRLPLGSGECLLDRLLREYIARGPIAFADIQGAYVITVIDSHDGCIHMARDGAGVRTAFYGRCGEDWLIASELKAITAQESFQREIRPAAIAQYLSFSFVPGCGTMLTDAFEVQCGQAVTLRRGCAPQFMELFPFEKEEPEDSEEPIDQSRWIQLTRQCVQRAVADRLPRGEPVGVFLSGGLDSSIIAAEVARQHSHTVKTYAIHFGKKYPNELEFARAVADRCGTEHHEILVEPKGFTKRMRQMVWHLDDPIGDPITQPNFELARRVSEDVRWVFNGEGGDPVFGGPKNIPMMLAHWYGVQRDDHFRERAYLASYRRAYEECSRVLHPELQARIDPNRDLEAVLTPFFRDAPLRSMLNKLMAINIRLKGAHLILPKVERMLAASGLVPLSPLFDEDLIRLSFQMPTRMKLRFGIEKWALKRAYDDALPAEIIDRPKSGMRVPVHYWFRGEMRRAARKVLAPRKLKRHDIFHPERVKQLLKYDIEEGAGRYGMRLWMLMTFELWRRIVIERESPHAPI